MFLENYGRETVCKSLGIVGGVYRGSRQLIKYSRHNFGYTPILIGGFLGTLYSFRGIKRIVIIAMRFVSEYRLFS